MRAAPFSGVLRYLRRLDVRQLPDDRLLEHFAGTGDGEAFAEIVRRHASLVFGVCERILRHTQDAEDAAQATFLVLARKAGSIAWSQSAAGWLHEVAVRVSLQARGSIARRRSHERAEAIPDRAGAKPPPPPPDLSDVLDEELARLPEKYRGVLALCYLEGKTRDEAAEQLGWSFRKVKGCLEKGRNLLRTRLTRRGLTLGAVLAAGLLATPVKGAVTPSLIAQTMTLVTGHIAAGAAPAALQLATGVLKTMLIARIKTAGMVMIAALALSLGAGLLAQRAFSGGEPKPAVVRQSEQKPAQDDKPKSKPEAKPEAKAPLIAEHGGPVRAVVFAPDGKHVASAAFDGTVKLWSAATGKEVRAWDVPGLNSAVAMTRDSKYLAAGNDAGEVQIWEAESGKSILALTTRQGNTYGLAFSPDGKQLASANHNGTVSLWNATTGAVVRHLTAHRGRVWSAAFSPDGKVLASSGEDRLARLHDAATGKPLRTLSGHRGNVGAVAFSRDGKKIVTADMQETFRDGRLPDGTNDTIRIWDTGTGKELIVIQTPLTHSVSFSPDGKLVLSCDRVGIIHLWDAATGRQVATLSGHTGPVLSAAFDAGGRRIVSSSQDNTVRIWAMPAAR